MLVPGCKMCSIELTSLTSCTGDRCGGDSQWHQDSYQLVLALHLGYQHLALVSCLCSELTHLFTQMTLPPTFKCTTKTNLSVSYTYIYMYPTNYWDFGVGNRSWKRRDCTHEQHKNNLRLKIKYIGCISPLHAYLDSSSCRVHTRWCHPPSCTLMCQKNSQMQKGHLCEQASKQDKPGGFVYLSATKCSQGN